MKKSLTVALLVVVLGLALAAPALAHEGHACEHDMLTVESLQHCVQHALAEGHIDSEGVANSLLAELTAAQAALDRGQTPVAVQLLRAFVAEVKAQAGKHIVAEHAAHLIEHAQMVIEALKK